MSGTELVIVAEALHARASDLNEEAAHAERTGRTCPDRPDPAVLRAIASEFSMLAAGITARIGMQSDRLRGRD